MDMNWRETKRVELNLTDTIEKSWINYKNGHNKAEFNG